MPRFTAAYLKKLEDFLSKNNYEVRYEKGNFKSGYCILEHKRIVVVTKYYDTEGRCSALTEIVHSLTNDGRIAPDDQQGLFIKEEDKEEKAAE